MPFLESFGLKGSVKTPSERNSSEKIYRKDKNRTEQQPLNNCKLHLNFLKSSSSSPKDAVSDQAPKRARPAFFLRASMTVEAAIALPLLIFMMYLLVYPMFVGEAERRLQNRLEGAAGDLAQAEYIRKTAEKLIRADSTVKEGVVQAAAGISGAVMTAAMLAAPETRYFSYMIPSAESSILSDDDKADPAMIRLKLDYRVETPFEIFDICMREKSLIVNRRAWIGSKGGRGAGIYGDEVNGVSESENDNRIVYLGRTSTEVYHLDPACHYLSNALMTADAGSMQDIRNESGGKYHACPSCSPSPEGRVYYSAHGSAYHGSADCKAITAYASAVRISECDGMRSCSYCGKNK